MGIRVVETKYSIIYIHQGGKLICNSIEELITDIKKLLVGLASFYHPPILIIKRSTSDYSNTYLHRHKKQVKTSILIN